MKTSNIIIIVVATTILVNLVLGAAYMYMQENTAATNEPAQTTDTAQTTEADNNVDTQDREERERVTESIVSEYEATLQELDELYTEMEAITDSGAEVPPAMTDRAAELEAKLAELFDSI